MRHSFPPYQINPQNFNSLRDVLVGQVDFEELDRHSTTKLFPSATNVCIGKVRIFDTEEIRSI